MGEAFLTAGGAGLLGYCVARRRSDLALPALRTGALSALLAAGFAAALAFAGAAWEAYLLFAALAPLAVIDARRMVLPDDITLPLIVIGPALGLLGGAGWGGALGAALGFGVLAALGQLRGGDGIGLGDAKLFAALGGFLGWAALPEVAFLAALGGIAHALVAHGWRARGRSVPFGPALIGAALASVLFGPIFG